MQTRKLLYFVLTFLVGAFGAFDASAHSGTSVDGTLTRLVGDPAPAVGGRARINYTVHADDGHVVPVDLTNAALPVGGVRAVLNKRVRVTTAVAMGDGLATDPKVPAVSVELLDTAVAADVFPTVVTRKYKTLLCRWPLSDVPGVPTLPTGYFTTQLGAVYPGFDHYFKEVSYGSATIAGSSASSAWVFMPHDHAFYNTSLNDGSYLPAMAQDCADAAAATGVSFVGFVGINFMFNGKVDDCCAWGGDALLTLNGAPRVVSATWMPYNPVSWGDFGWHEHGVLAHELSHSFGSPHSDDPSGYQYGNQWDVVSSPGGTCLVVDANYGCVGQHQVSDNKLTMGFIAPARIATVAAGASGTYSVERAAQPPNVGGTFQVVKVLTPSVHRYFTVESRLRTSYDQNLPGDGVIIMEVVDNRVSTGPSDAADPARLVIPGGGTGPGLGGLVAKWSAGQVFTDATANIMINVVSFAGDGTAVIQVQPLAPPEYNFTATGYTVIEGGPVVNVAVTRSYASSDPGSVTWTTSDNTMLAGTDYGTLGNTTPLTGTLTWTAGTGGTKNITVGLVGSNIPVIDDTTQDPSGTFGITLSSPVGGTLGAQSSTSVLINDSDSTIGFASATATVAEPAGNVVLTVSRTGATALAQTVNWATANGTAIAGQDFGTLGISSQRSGTLTFPVGSSADQTITIPIINDTLIEPDETFTVALSAPSNGVVLGTSSATVTIVSDDAGISMDAATRTFSEGAGAQSIVINRAGPATAPASVSFTVVNGTAINGTHFTAPASGTRNWGIGDTTPQSIDVTIGDDAVVNTTRTFTVTLSAASGAPLLTPMSTAVSITDNDELVQFSAPTATATEGMSGNVLNLMVTRTGALAGTADVTYTTVDGSALVGTDFGVLGNLTPLTGTVSWAAGVGGSKTVAIPIINDTVPEGAKTFQVQLSNPVGAGLSIGTNSQVTVTLNDNDSGVVFNPTTYSVTEGTNLSVILTVQRIGPHSLAASATWATVNGSATTGQDFGTLGSSVQRTGTVSWIAGDAANKTITIPIIDDTIGGEGDETFTVVLTPGSGLAAIPSVATVTIHDNDIPPESNVQFSQSKYVVLENAGTVTLTLQRPPITGVGLGASVNYATVAGTALATSDYITKSGTVTWPPSDGTDKTIAITIVNNTVAEPPKGFKVVLSAPSPGLGFGTPSEATVVILDDDELFPPLGAMPAGFTVAAGATKGWHVSNDPGAYEGAYSLKSDEIDDSQTAGLEMSGVFAAGPVNFRVKVSSELNFDFLRFYVDGVLRQSWSGTAVTTWVAATPVTLTAAHHVLKWAYEKDANASLGLDAAYIDALTTPAFTPDP